MNGCYERGMSYSPLCSQGGKDLLCLGHQLSGGAGRCRIPLMEMLRKRSEKGPSGRAQECSVPPQYGRKTKRPPEAVPQSLCRGEISPAALCMGCRRSERELCSHTVCKTAPGCALHWLPEAEYSEVCPFAEGSTTQDQALLHFWEQELYRHA